MKGSILPTWNPDVAPPGEAAWKKGILALPCRFNRSPGPIGGLLSERDSKTTVVTDGENSHANINAKGSRRPVRKISHELPMDLWKTLLGITDGSHWKQQGKWQSQEQEQEQEQEISNRAGRLSLPR